MTNLGRPHSEQQVAMYVCYVRGYTLSRNFAELMPRRADFGTRRRYCVSMRDTTVESG